MLEHRDTKTYTNAPVGNWNTVFPVFLLKDTNACNASKDELLCHSKSKFMENVLNQYIFSKDAS